MVPLSLRAGNLLVWVAIKNVGAGPAFFTDADGYTILVENADGGAPVLTAPVSWSCDDASTHRRLLPSETLFVERSVATSGDVHRVIVSARLGVMNEEGRCVANEIDLQGTASMLIGKDGGIVTP